MSTTGPVHAFTDDALGDHDAVGVARLVAGGERSAGEMVEAAIARVEEVNPRLNAVAHADHGRARSLARLTTGEGPLAGVPTVIKDNADMAGLPTGHGSRAVPGDRARADSVFVAQYLSMGPIPLGKSTLPEFGLTATTESMATGPTRNPWDLGHSPGGSSGGSASLVAAGVVPLAHGNDGGGSIRIPAACCGLVGLKPSRGRIIDQPELDRAPINVVCQGILSRSVRDAAAYLHAAELRYRNPTLPPIGAAAGPGTERLRIGFYTDTAHGAASDPDVVAGIENAAGLCAELGHDVEPVDNPATAEVADDFLLYWAAMAQALSLFGRQLVGQKVRRQALEPFTRTLARHFRRRIHRAPGAIARLRRFADDHDRPFRTHDVLLSPTLARAPVAIGELGPDVPGEEALELLLGYAAFTPMQNVSGVPAVSLPLARTVAGLPIGVHFAAARGHERRLLDLAFALEEAAPFARLGA